MYLFHIKRGHGAGNSELVHSSANPQRTHQALKSQVKECLVSPYLKWRDCSRQLLRSLLTTTFYCSMSNNIT